MATSEGERAITRMTKKGTASVRRAITSTCPTCHSELYKIVSGGGEKKNVR